MSGSVSVTPRIVAIDGPAGAGKSTVARRVAEALGFDLVDTGAIYRAVALIAVRRSLSAEGEIAAAIPAMDIHIERGHVRLGGEDVSAAIRTPEISNRSSQVSAMPEVRRALLGIQRQVALEAPNGAVLEGRDIGTVVFPDAPVKVFLTASPEERAQRRTLELERAGRPQPYDEVLSGIVARDKRDQERPVAPLKPAADAIHVDTTGRPLDGIVAELVEIVRAKLA